MHVCMCGGGKARQGNTRRGERLPMSGGCGDGDGDGVRVETGGKVR